MPTTEWNAELYREHSSLQQAMAAEVLQAIKLTSSDRVLDIGCGDGRITSEIARRVPNGCVVGVDASSNMIELASQNIRPNLHFKDDFLTAAEYVRPRWSRPLPRGQRPDWPASQPVGRLGLDTARLNTSGNRVAIVK